MSTLFDDIFSTVRRTVMAALVVILLATNILAITSTAFHGFMYELFSATPFKGFLSNSPMKRQQIIDAENQMLRNKNQDLDAKLNNHHEKLSKARKVSQRIAGRTVRNVTINVASVTEQAMPYLGAAVVVAVTAMDVKHGCDTVRDVNEMLRILEVDSTEGDEGEVCGIKVPSVDEVLESIKQNIGGTVDDAQDKTDETARKFYNVLGESMRKMLDDNDN